MDSTLVNPPLKNSVEMPKVAMRPSLPLFSAASPQDAFQYQTQKPIASLRFGGLFKSPAERAKAVIKMIKPAFEEGASPNIELTLEDQNNDGKGYSGRVMLNPEAKVSTRGIPLIYRIHLNTGGRSIDIGDKTTNTMLKIYQNDFKGQAIRVEVEFKRLLRDKRISKDITSSLTPNEIDLLKRLARSLEEKSVAVDKTNMDKLPEFVSGVVRSFDRAQPSVDRMEEMVRHEDFRAFLREVRFKGHWYILVYRVFDDTEEGKRQLEITDYSTGKPHKRILFEVSNSPHSSKAVSVKASNGDSNFVDIPPTPEMIRILSELERKAASAKKYQPASATRLKPE